MTDIMEHGKRGLAPFEKRSLNKDRRKRDLLKIMMENQVIFASYLTDHLEKNSGEDVEL
jgi:hypothetical protein